MNINDIILYLLWIFSYIDARLYFRSLHQKEKSFEQLAGKMVCLDDVFASTTKQVIAQKGKMFGSFHIAATQPQRVIEKIFQEMFWNQEAIDEVELETDRDINTIIKEKPYYAGFDTRGHFCVEAEEFGLRVAEVRPALQPNLQTMLINAIHSVPDVSENVDRSRLFGGRWISQLQDQQARRREEKSTAEIRASIRNAR